MSRKTITIISAVLALTTMFIAGCESDAQTGALLGTAIGAGIGQAVGGNTEGTLIGAAVGGGAGYMVGNEGDKKKTTAQLRDEMNTVMVNVTNTNGSIIQVPLKKQGVGYVGPRGEYYSTLPSCEALRPVYGF